MKSRYGFSPNKKKIEAKEGTTTWFFRDSFLQLFTIGRMNRNFLSFFVEGARTIKKRNFAPWLYKKTAFGNKILTS